MKRQLPQEDLDYLLNIIRRGTTEWKGRAECLKRVRKKKFEGYYKNGNKIFKFYWRCEKCDRWYRDEKELEVDHIEEIGPYRGDIHEYALRVYCDQDNLMALCITCHMKKTTQYNSAASKWKRKPLKD